MNYDRLCELAQQYARLKDDETSDLVFSLKCCIEDYDRCWGDMPGKEKDLDNAALWLVNLIQNDYKYDTNLEYYISKRRSKVVNKYLYTNCYKEKIKWFNLNGRELEDIRSHLDWYSDE
jgi:hypothetical protein